MSELGVFTIPCRQDNYSYLVGAREAGGRVPKVAVVDPCELAPITAELSRQGAEPVAILNTHHHGDHVGGNRGLLERYPGIPIYAHVSDKGRIPGQTHYLEDGDTLNAAGVGYEVLFTPGHTTGHVVYVGPGLAFVGDTVFGGGCGRLKGGTAAMHYHSLNHKIAALPGETQLYFAHEYTADNLRFALSVEPENTELQARVQEVSKARAAGKWSTPTTLELEKATNPFFRAHVSAIQDRFGGTPALPEREAAVFAALRCAKDVF